MTIGIATREWWEKAFNAASKTGAVLGPILIAYLAFLSNENKNELSLEIENLKGNVSQQVETIKGDYLVGIQQMRGENTINVAEINASVEQAQNEIEAKIAESTIEMQQQDLEMRHLQFDADEKARRDQIIRQYVPMLLGASPLGRNEAIAVLVSIYPNDAKTILATVAESQSEAYGRILEPMIERAEAVDELVGSWIVVVSNDPTLEGAAIGVQKYTDTGFTPTVYVIEGLYVTTVGPYPSLEDAERSQITLRAELAPGAYVLNLNRSCPVSEYIADGNYYECHLAEE